MMSLPPRSVLCLALQGCENQSNLYEYTAVSCVLFVMHTRPPLVTVLIVALLACVTILIDADFTSKKTSSFDRDVHTAAGNDREVGI